MEIEPEVLPPDGQFQGPRMPPNRPPWQSVLAGVVGLGLFILIAWLAFWLFLVLIGLALLGWVVRKVMFLFTGKTTRSGSNFQVTVRRGPRR